MAEKCSVWFWWTDPLMSKRLCQHKKFPEVSPSVLFSAIFRWSGAEEEEEEEEEEVSDTFTSIISAVWLVFLSHSSSSSSAAVSACSAHFSESMGRLLLIISSTAAPELWRQHRCAVWSEPPKLNDKQMPDNELRVTELQRLTPQTHRQTDRWQTALCCG